MAVIPECGWFGRSEEEQRKEGEEKADDDAVEHRAAARVALGCRVTGTAATTAASAAEGVDPLFLERSRVFLVCTPGASG